MKTVSILFIFLIASFFAYTQSFEIEKLREQVKNHPQQDSFRVNRLNAICNNFSSARIPVEDIEKFSTEALNISRQINYVEGEAYSLISKARAAYASGRKEESARLLYQADTIATTLGDDDLHLWVLIRLAACFQSTDYRQSLNWALKAEELAQAIGNKVLLSKTQTFVGASYWGLSDFAMAMEYVTKALKSAEEVNCLDCQVFAWQAITNIYISIGDYEKSNQYSQKLYKGYNQLGYTGSVRDEILNVIGETYRLMGKYQEALVYYRQSIQGNTSPVNRAYTESNMADVFVRTDSIEQAFEYALKSQAAAKKLDDVTLEAWIYGILSRAYLKMKMPDSAIHYAQLGLSAGEKLGTIELIRDNTLAMANAFAFKNDYKKAYQYHNLYINYRDSMLNNEVKNRTAIIEHNYALEKKEAQIALLSQQKRLQKNTLLAVSAVTILILITALVLLRSNRQKQKAKQNIEKAYDELKITQAQLIQSEKMASLGELTAGIAHEIQNPLNFVNNFSEVNIELIDDMQQAVQSGNMDEAFAISTSLKDNEEKIIHHGKRADAIVKGMLQHSRASAGEKETVDINSLTEEYLQLSYHGIRAKEKNLDVVLKTELDTGIGNLEIVPQDIGRVLLNIFNNAFYSVKQKKKEIGTNYEPIVAVSTEKNNGNIEIHIRDNGVGIPHKQVDKIFQPFFTTKPTSQGIGLGLSVSYDIVKAHGGSIIVKTKEGEGAEFVIHLPANEDDN
jgi:two-component system, NtrC family, sensor kinase